MLGSTPFHLREAVPHAVVTNLQNSMKAGFGACIRPTHASLPLARFYPHLTLTAWGGARLPRQHALVHGLRNLLRLALRPRVVATMTPASAVISVTSALAKSARASRAAAAAVAAASAHHHRHCMIPGS